MDELVKLKGVGDGVRISLSPSHEFSEIIKSLHSKLDEYRRFFGSGGCNIYFVGRELSQADKLRLESVVKSMLPDASVVFGERKIFNHKKYTAPKKEEPKPYVPTMEEVIASNFKANRARFFEGLVKSGKRLVSDSHLVLVGDVMAGAEVCAAGNIIIFGRLMGVARAGEYGSKEAYILAMDFCPEGISIAGIELKNCNYDMLAAKKAKLINNEIFIEDFLLNI